MRFPDRSTVATWAPSMLTSMRPLPGPRGATTATARPLKGRVASAPAPRAVRTLLPDALARRRVLQEPVHATRSPAESRTSSRVAMTGETAVLPARSRATIRKRALAPLSRPMARAPRSRARARRFHEPPVSRWSSVRSTPLTGSDAVHEMRTIAVPSNVPPWLRVTRGRELETSGASRSMRSVTSASAVASPTPACTRRW
jgi:hypothetical protein